MNIEHLRDTLQAKQAELQQRITAIGNDFRKGRSADFAEQTSESENDEVLENIRIEAKFELQQVNDALARIDNQHYGFCAKCAEKIAPQRLAALPYVTTCINCSE